jgi:glycosyltransferase involved in cell wall biosynthesis
MRPVVSLVICTYNRAELLHHCLLACAALRGKEGDFEVVVIDNKCTDRTQEVVASHVGHVPGLRVVREEKQGLSHARNRGIEEAQSDWIYFIDDDAKVAPDFIERALACIEEVKPLVFGGTFAPWYHYGQPRWFKDHYASSDLRYPVRRVLPKGRFLTGCNFCVHRSVFERFGTFDPNLGMRGNLVGYGEETELQREIQAAGMAIWFEPALKMDHVVNAERLNVSWQIASGWALGRDRVRSGKVPRNPGYLTAVLITGLALTVVSASVNGLKLLAQRDYYKENWWIDTFRKAAKRAAILYTASLE